MPVRSAILLKKSARGSFADCRSLPHENSAATDPVDDSRAAEIAALLVGVSGEEGWVEWDYRHIRAVAGDPEMVARGLDRFYPTPPLR